jgi:hypothetical protein
MTAYDDNDISVQGILNPWKMLGKDQHPEPISGHNISIEIKSSD